MPGSSGSTKPHECMMTGRPCACAKSMVLLWNGMTSSRYISGDMNGRFLNPMSSKNQIPSGSPSRSNNISHMPMHMSA